VTQIFIICASSAVDDLRAIALVSAKWFPNKWWYLRYSTIIQNQPRLFV